MAGLVWATTGVSAEVYRVVDENGNVTYTDTRPSPDAQPMKLPGLSVISPQVPTRPPAPMNEDGSKPDPKVTNIRELRRGYRDFAITHPIQDQVFAGNGNEISGVAWSTRFALQEGMRVTVYLDDQPQTPTTNTVIDLGRIDRGTHVVRAELLDARNRVIATTEPVTFHMRQHSVILNRQDRGG
jgi:hypothetical protein